jgi:hypothetical protein
MIIGLCWLLCLLIFGAGSGAEKRQKKVIDTGWRGV